MPNKLEEIQRVERFSFKVNLTWNLFEEGDTTPKAKRQTLV